MQPRERSRVHKVHRPTARAVPTTDLIASPGAVLSPANSGLATKPGMLRLPVNPASVAGGMADDGCRREPRVSDGDAHRLSLLTLTLVTLPGAPGSKVGIPEYARL